MHKFREVPDISMRGQCRLQPPIARVVKKQTVRAHLCDARLIVPFKTAETPSSRQTLADSYAEEERIRGCPRPSGYTVSVMRAVCGR